MVKKATQRGCEILAHLNICENTEDCDSDENFEFIRRYNLERGFGFNIKAN